MEKRKAKFRLYDEEDFFDALRARHSPSGKLKKEKPNVKYWHQVIKYRWVPEEEKPRRRRRRRKK